MSYSQKVRMKSSCCYNNTGKQPMQSASPLAAGVTGCEQVSYTCMRHALVATWGIPSMCRSTQLDDAGVFLHFTRTEWIC